MIAALSCQSPASALRAGPHVVVLGTAQDGGLPHAACTCLRCERAQRDPSFRRRIASLAVVLPATSAEASRVFLIDASPDLRDQLVLLAGVRDGPPGRVDRAPVDGILLTHAHAGHYVGLAFLGFEAIHAREIPVFATPRMTDFLRANGPWNLLVDRHEIVLRAVEPGEAIELGAGVRACPIRVPHRDELSDTVAWRLDGPRSRVLYVPDTDSWQAWERPLTEVLEGIDVALLDGTFYSRTELPDRDVASIGHPLMTETMELLEPLVRTGKLRVLFTHLNHSNPALEREGAKRREIEARGFAVLGEGALIDL